VKVKHFYILPYLQFRTCEMKICPKICCGFRIHITCPTSSNFLALRVYTKCHMLIPFDRALTVWLILWIITDSLSSILHSNIIHTECTPTAAGKADGRSQPVVTACQWTISRCFQQLSVTRRITFSIQYVCMSRCILLLQLWSTLCHDVSILTSCFQYFILVPVPHIDEM